MDEVWRGSSWYFFCAQRSLTIICGSSGFADTVGSPVEVFGWLGECVCVLKMI
jgi:hypothetical protein